MAADANLTSRLPGRPLIAPSYAVKQHPQPATPSGNAVSRYISVAVFEWLLVLNVRMGV
jgi:hypothetical protein